MIDYNKADNGRSDSDISGTVVEYASEMSPQPSHRVVMAPMVRGSELAFRMMVRHASTRHRRSHHHHHQQQQQQKQADTTGVEKSNEIANSIELDCCYGPMLRANEILIAYKYWKEYLRENQEPTPHETSILDVDGTGDNGNMNVDIEAIFQSKVWNDWNLSITSSGSVTTTSPKGLHEDGLLFLTDISSNQHDCESLVVQLCGNCPNILYEATQAILERYDYLNRNCKNNNKVLQGIDLNCGCPQSCAKEGKFGAYLAQENPNLAVECITSMRKAIDDYYAGSDATKGKPKLSCKMRLLDTVEQTVDLAQRFQDAGCDILALHCRHRTTKHNGAPNMAAGRQVIESLKNTSISSNGQRMHVLFNGNIQKLSDLHDTFSSYPDIYGIMAGRAFLQNPYILASSDHHHHRYHPELHQFQQPELMINTNGSPPDEENMPDPEFLAATYLDYAELYPPPSTYYIRNHMRWIFRNYLSQPVASQKTETMTDNKNCRYLKHWRYHIWTFFVRPYLETIDQFRLIILLYIQLNYQNVQDHDDKNGGSGAIDHADHSSLRKVTTVDFVLKAMPRSLQILLKKQQEPITFKRIRHYRGDENNQNDDDEEAEFYAEFNNIFQ